MAILARELSTDTVKYKTCRILDLTPPSSLPPQLTSLVPRGDEYPNVRELADHFKVGRDGVSYDAMAGCNGCSDDARIMMDVAMFYSQYDSEVSYKKIIEMQSQLTQFALW